jgi:hypothetical protein
MADLIVHLGLSKPWNIAHLLSVEHKKIKKKPRLEKRGFKDCIIALKNKEKI